MEHFNFRSEVPASSKCYNSSSNGNQILTIFSEHSTLDFFKTFHFISLMVKVLLPINAWYLLKEHNMGKFLTNYQLPVLSLLGFMEI